MSCATSFAHRDLVLVGGMALRLRGSNRFTIFDTDSSTRNPPTGESELRRDPTQPIEDEFSLTVNERGLEMALDEQTAEKIMGWCGNSLAKHYVDLGWIGRELGDELDPETLRAMCGRKLEVNRGIFPGYEHFGGVADLIAPLSEPDTYFGPNNFDQNLKAGSLRFVGNGMSLDKAKAYVRERIVPLLEGSEG